MNTPSQTVGPFFSIGLEHLCAPRPAEAHDVIVSGRVLDGDGVGIPDAVLETWDQSGNTFQRVLTNDTGAFAFVAGSSDRPLTSHMIVLVFMRGLLKHVTTRVFFPSGGDSDPILAHVTPARRSTLIARRTDDARRFEWDIVMQGPSETVFFAC